MHRAFHNYLKRDEGDCPRGGGLRVSKLSLAQPAVPKKAADPRPARETSGGRPTPPASGPCCAASLPGGDSESRRGATSGTRDARPALPLPGIPKRPGGLAGGARSQGLGPVGLAGPREKRATRLSPSSRRKSETTN